MAKLLKTPTHNQTQAPDPYPDPFETGPSTEELQALLGEAKAQLEAQGRELAELQRKLAAVVPKATQSDQIIRYAFPLQDANRAASLLPNAVSFRFPFGDLGGHWRRRLFSLAQGLEKSGARLSDGRAVQVPAHAIMYWLDNARCGELDKGPAPRTASPGVAYRAAPAGPKALPCKGCGFDPILAPDQGTGYSIRCGNIECHERDGFIAADVNTVIERWNEGQK